MVKSAYEAALEKLAKQGIAEPDAEALSEQQRQAIAEVRKKAEGRLAELEIMHTKRLQGLIDSEERRIEEEGYLRERRRINDECDREVRRLREG